MVALLGWWAKVPDYMKAYYWKRVLCVRHWSHPAAIEHVGEKPETLPCPGFTPHLNALGPIFTRGGFQSVWNDFRLMPKRVESEFWAQADNAGMQRQILERRGTTRHLGARQVQLVYVSV